MLWSAWKTGADLVEIAGKTRAGGVENSTVDLPTGRVSRMRD